MAANGNNNPVTYDQMLELAQLSDQLLIERNKLRAIYRLPVNQNKLDKGNQMTRPTSSPSYLGLQSIAQPGPRPLIEPEFNVEKFFEPKYRSSTFDLLFRRIEAVEHRTAVLRQAYYRNENRLNRVAFDWNVANWTAQFSDLTDLINCITTYTQSIKDLLSYFENN